MFKVFLAEVHANFLQLFGIMFMAELQEVHNCLHADVLHQSAFTHVFEAIESVQVGSHQQVQLQFLSDVYVVCVDVLQ